MKTLEKIYLAYYVAAYEISDGPADLIKETAAAVTVAATMFIFGLLAVAIL